jgi:uncharacterized membrane protein YdbT with pleckstrin-like domain
MPVSYVERNLISGETILYRTGLHWIVLFFPVVLGVFFIGISVFAFTSGELGVGAALVGIGALITAIAVIVRNSTEMAVTNRRVVIKTGVFRRRTIELFLSKVESIDVDQSIVARMFGYGKIVVRGTGGTNEPFDKVRSPLEFRHQVQQFTVG